MGRNAGFGIKTKLASLAKTKFLRERLTIKANKRKTVNSALFSQT